MHAVSDDPSPHSGKEISQRICNNLRTWSGDSWGDRPRDARTHLAGRLIYWRPTLATSRLCHGQMFFSRQPHHGPGRAVAVIGPRLLIIHGNPAYFAANLSDVYK